MSDERRYAVDRQRTLIAAVARYGSGALSCPCRIRNISPGGARLAVDPAVTLPDRFTLEIPSRGATHSVEVRWRSADEMGVQFVDGVVEKTPEDRLQELEAENEKLRKLVRELKFELAKRLADDGT